MEGLQKVPKKDFKLIFQHNHGPNVQATEVLGFSCSKMGEILNDLQKRPSILEERIYQVASEEPEGTVFRLHPLAIPEPFRVPRGAGDVMGNLKNSAHSPGSGATFDTNASIAHNAQRANGSAPEKAKEARRKSAKGE